MKYLVFFIGFSFAVVLYEPKVIFSYNNKQYTDVDFFEQVFKDDWDGFDNHKKRSLYNDYLKRELSYLMAFNKGVHLIPSVKIKLDKTYNGLIINNTYEHLIARPMIDVEVVEKNIKNLLYKAEAYHLLVGFSGSVQNTESHLTQNEAKSLIDSVALLIGGAEGDLVENFKSFAKTYSIDPSVEKNGGYLGWVPWGRTVMSFQEPLFLLDINVVSPPVLTEYGYHLVLKTDQTFSNHYFYNKKHYTDLAYKVAQNTLLFDSLKIAATKHDSLLLNASGFSFYDKNIDSLFVFLKEKQTTQVSGNKNLLVGWLGELGDFGVLFTANGRGFGVGWFIDKLEKTSSSRIPSLNKKENLVLSLESLFLQDLVLQEGFDNKIDTTTSFNRDILNSQKDILQNEYLSYLLNNIPKPDSIDVIKLYNSGVYNKEFVKPFRVVFSEIRVFDEGVAFSVLSRVNAGENFDSLLVEFGGSIKEPVSVGATSPIAEAAFGLSVGDFSNVINNKNGSFSVLRIERFLNEEPFELSLVYSQIERKIITQKQEDIKVSLLDSLIKNLDIEINYGALGL